MRFIFCKGSYFFIDNLSIIFVILVSGVDKQVDKIVFFVVIFFVNIGYEKKFNFIFRFDVIFIYCRMF